MGFGLVNNHSFIDGNKRIGILTMMTFLQLNGIPIECSDEELIQIGLGLASSKISQDDLLEWIINQTS